MHLWNVWGSWNPPIFEAHETDELRKTHETKEARETYEIREPRKNHKA